MNLLIDNEWTTTLNDLIADNQQEGCEPLTNEEKQELLSLQIGEEIRIGMFDIKRIQ